MTYPDSVQYLYLLGNEIKTIKMGLERISVLLAALNHPEHACRWVHVAGTNGKGSTCVMIESSLRAAGFRTGLYTSPHLVEPIERIQINGEPVTREEFAEAFRKVHACANQLIDNGGIDGHPTYFETVTAMAFLLFHEKKIDIGVIEVGLGGRLDATNVITPELSVITPVDFDHEAWLGNSLRAIAGEKAGIIKPGVPVVAAGQRAEAMDRIREAAAGASALLQESSLCLVHNLELDPNGCRFQTVIGQEAVMLECPLAGLHQVANIRTAVTALQALGLSVTAIQEGIARAQWPGRLERVSASPDIILDGAHNPAGIRALTDHITRFYADRKVWLIYATMRDKSVDEIGERLSGAASEIILTMSDSARSLRPETLRPMFPHPQVRTAPRLAQALELAAEAAPSDVIFICGSLFLVGEAKALFSKAPAVT
ncbi:MAG: bifunctional folylpolyglutamate synthase/dihydrofolate synthase [Acidimicrobiia bacterium]|nr:bifunctional folylpolyglutamate synthase/dihydrofolate synthase [Acidimicrobiia bacterium]